MYVKIRHEAEEKFITVKNNDAFLIASYGNHSTYNAVFEKLFAFILIF